MTTNIERPQTLSQLIETKRAHAVWAADVAECVSALDDADIDALTLHQRMHFDRLCKYMVERSPWSIPTWMLQYMLANITFDVHVFVIDLILNPHVEFEKVIDKLDYLETRGYDVGKVCSLDLFFEEADRWIGRDATDEEKVSFRREKEKREDWLRRHDAHENPRQSSPPKKSLLDDWSILTTDHLEYLQKRDAPPTEIPAAMALIDQTVRENPTRTISHAHETPIFMLDMAIAQGGKVTPLALYYVVVSGPRTDQELQEKSRKLRWLLDHGGNPEDKLPIGNTTKTFVQVAHEKAVEYEDDTYYRQNVSFENVRLWAKWYKLAHSMMKEHVDRRT